MITETVEHLLASKRLGRIYFNTDFTILDACQIAQSMLKSLTVVNTSDHLLDTFPEFIGSEDLLQEVVKKRKGSYRLDYVNRLDTSGQRQYFDFLILPDDLPDRGLLIIEEVTDKARMHQELNQKKYELFLYQGSTKTQKKVLSGNILGNSPAIEHVREMVQKLSQVPKATVLLLGDSGTGKNLTAQVIHYSSMPADAPFVDINCAALPENLIESELFGYEKGAFTHAAGSRAGLLETAANGTIFLNEIGELPINLQAKLLSVIEAKKFRRLGSNKLIGVNARIIAATNRDLQAEVAQKKFRLDLFHRLNVVTITMPRLCQMDEDVILIADHLLNLYNREFNKHVKGFTKAAQRVLIDYNWPGNVRELGNCVERAMIFCESDWIDKPDLILHKPTYDSQEQQWAVPSEGLVLEDVEKQLILSALKQAGSNKSKAARLLGLTRDTLRYRLEKYQIDNPV